MKTKYIRRFTQDLDGRLVEHPKGGYCLFSDYLVMRHELTALVESKDAARYHLKGIVNEIAALTKRNQTVESVVGAVERVMKEPNKEWLPHD